VDIVNDTAAAEIADANINTHMHISESDDFVTDHFKTSHSEVVYSYQIS